MNAAAPITEILGFGITVGEAWLFLDFGCLGSGVNGCKVVAILNFANYHFAMSGIA